MPRFQPLFCFTILAATITFFNVASGHVKIKPVLPQIQDPTTVKDVESYSVKVVTNFLADLEKECPKTDKFKVFFEKLKVYSKYLCPVSKAGGYESDMKAKAGSLFEAISALSSVENRSRGGQGNMSLQRGKTEAMNTVKLLQSIGEKIASGRNNKQEKLTVEQQKEIKDGILKWIQVITRIAKTCEENNSKASSKSQARQNSKGEKSSTQTQPKRRSQREKAQITVLPRGSRVTKVGSNDYISRRRKSKTNTKIKE